jgi:Cu/Ag efflux protein CusF
MTYRVFFTVPVLALGLACSTTQSSKGSASAQPPGQTGATASGSASESGVSGNASAGGMGATGSAGTGMHGDVKGHASDMVISGRISKASPDSLEIQSADGTMQQLSLADQTMVTVDGRDAHASDLTPGQDVRASFNQQDGRNVAVKIEAGQSMGGSSSGSTSGSGSSGSSDTGGASGTASPGSANPNQPQGSSTGSKW